MTQQLIIVSSFCCSSAQGQFPFITLNGKEFHDSQFVIEHLTKLKEKDLNANLNQAQKATSRSFLKLLEESFKWYKF
jgi:hypothetical protein